MTYGITIRGELGYKEADAGRAGPTYGVILAGGLARRMGGGDKGLLRLRGERVLDRIVRQVRPQVDRLALNANGDPWRFADLGLPVLPDSVPRHPGPLAGVLAGMDWAAKEGAEWLLTVPADCPFLPSDLVAVLHGFRGDAAIAFASSAGRMHPVIALWPTALHGPLRAALEQGVRKVDAFAGRYKRAVAVWPTGETDPFFNVNTPADLAEAERLLGQPPLAAPS